MSEDLRPRGANIARIEAVVSVHAWRNPPLHGSDVWCGSRAVDDDVTAIVDHVTCRDCLRRMGWPLQIRESNR